MATYRGKYIRTDEIKRKNSLSNFGHITSEITKKKQRNSMLGKNKGRRLDITGKKHPNWKGGIRTGRYRFIYVPKHPFAIRNYVPEHRLIMEEKIGRYLSEKEVVHHIDNNPLNNNINNLILFPNFMEHQKFHRLIEEIAIKNNPEIIKKAIQEFRSKIIFYG